MLEKINVLKIIRNKHLWYCTVFLDTMTLYHLFNKINILSVPMSILPYKVKHWMLYVLLILDIKNDNVKKHFILIYR